MDANTFNPLTSSRGAQGKSTKRREAGRPAGKRRRPSGRTSNAPAVTSGADTEARRGDVDCPLGRPGVQLPENAFRRPQGGRRAATAPGHRCCRHLEECSSGPACQDSRHARFAQTHKPPIGSEDSSGIPPAQECQLGRRARAKRPLHSRRGNLEAIQPNPHRNLADSWLNAPACRALPIPRRAGMTPY